MTLLRLERRKDSRRTLRATGDQHDAFELAQRIARGELGPDEQAWLAKAFSAFIAAGGALPLERCLGLPRNDYSFRRASRDYWLRLAWKSLEGSLSPWQRSEELAASIREFRTRRWARWRSLEEPPIYAEQAESALFWAFRSSERVPSSAMQLHNIACQRSRT